MEQLHISLTPTLTKFVRQELATGSYRDESDVVAKALQREQRYKRKLKALKKALAPGLADLERGDTIAYSREDLLAELYGKH
jgi:putative addiction module CopG family antidote